MPKDLKNPIPSAELESIVRGTMRETLDLFRQDPPTPERKTKPRSERPPKSALEKQHDAERMAKEFATVGTKIRREEANAFKAWCQRRSLTAHTAIRNYILACIAEDNEAPGE